MNQQSTRQTTTFVNKVVQTMHLFLSTVIMLLATTSLTQAGAAESTLEEALRTSDFKTQKLGYELLAGHSSLVIQAEPRDKKIAQSLGYAKIQAWFDTEDQLTRKIVLFDETGKILSTVLFGGVKDHKGRKQASQMEVTNHKTGQTCTFEINRKLNKFTFM